MAHSKRVRRRAVLYALATLLLVVPVSAGADEEYHFDAPVFEIEATADGGILVAEHTTIKEIRRGAVNTVAEVDSITSVQGLAATGRGSFFASTGALDLAAGAAVHHVSRGGVRMVADIEAFETAEDPDVASWKVAECEPLADPQFSAGPQSNPYHIVGLTGSTALVADAAGNTLLATKINGDIELVATLTPPTDEFGDFLVLLPADGFDCYVQPVPTAVDVGPDGAYYVGELTGVPAVPGWSRVWRIEAGARGVECPSTDCVEVVSGLTSVIDVTFGPDGLLYVLEYDANGWFDALVFGNAAGGTIKACDVGTGDCEIVEDGLIFPGAITFDKWGDLWLLESNIISPVVRRVDLD